jgi:uncharacterized protein (TIGR03435 family)
MTRHSVQLAMQRSILVAVVVVLGAALFAQTPPAQGDAPGFEVASVKLNTSGDGFVRIGGPPGRFNATNVPLRMLIQMAYQIQPFQLEGGPSWTNSDRFDIVAKVGGDLPVPSAPGIPGPIQLMMRTLMADRFKLVVHHEMKEQTTYALVLARVDGKLGPQLRMSATDCVALAAARGRGGALPPPPAPGVRPQCGAMMRPGGLSAGGTSIAQLVGTLSANLQRIVVDRTGLTGTFDVDLTWTPDQMSQGRGDLPPGAPALPPIDPNGPSLFTAIQEQLGLKLESTKGPADMLVIDRAEKPTDD